MSTLTCNNGEVYVSVTKKCMSWGTEESYKILNGATELKTSAPFANNEQRTDEYFDGDDEQPVHVQDHRLVW